MEKLSEAYLLLSGLGVAISIYLAHDYLTESFEGCYINQRLSCSGVFQSGYTSMFGIPFFVLGLVWFPLALVIGLVTSRGGKDPVNAEILLPFLMVGNIFTVYLWYLELVAIGVICPLCVSLYGVNYALTALVLRSVI